MNHFQLVWQAADGLERFALVALMIGTLAQSAFVITYARRPWYRVRIGRALMLKSASLAVLLWLSVLGTFFVYPYEREVSAATIGVITVAILYQLIALLMSPRNPYG